MNAKTEKPSLRPDTAKYTSSRTASGSKSYHSGDGVGEALAGATLDEAYRLAAAATGDTQKALREKYGHLNEGMQRMNLGNRIRGHVNKLEKAEEGDGFSWLDNEAGFIRDAVAKREAAAQKAADEKAAAAAKKAADKKPAKGKK